MHSAPRFHGIIPPMLTPLPGPDELDVEGLERLVERLIAGGVSGLLLLGTTGEGPSLSHRLRRELVEHACKFAQGRVNILVCITDTSAAETIALARYAAGCGADALVLSTPYYFPLAQPELVEYVERIVPKLPLPVLLYNMPSHTKVPFEPSIVHRLMQHTQIVGLKDSGGDLRYFGEVAGLLGERPDWSLLVGPEQLLIEAMQLGGHGGVCGGANLFPRLYVDLYEACLARDEARISACRAKIQPVSKLYRVGRHAGMIARPLKTALQQLGICRDVLAEPFQAFSGEEREELERLVAELIA